MSVYFLSASSLTGWVVTALLEFSCRQIDIHEANNGNGRKPYSIEAG